MFNELFKRPWVVARHATAPFAEERARYLDYCRQRGDTRATLSLKAQELLWVARRLSRYSSLEVTIEQVRAVATDWRDRESACGRKLNARWACRRFVDTASSWLRYLGYLNKPAEQIPFQSRLDDYCTWARDERGFTEATLEYLHGSIKQFLRWYGSLGRPLSDIQVSDIDAYLAYGSGRGWCRVTLRNIAGTLRIFFRYGAEQGWCSSHFVKAIQGPRIYALEKLPAGPAWKDVQRMFSALDLHRPKDVRDRAILMLLAIYGLRESEVAKLRLEDLDWEHDVLHVPRVKRREAQTYPLLPSLGNALIEYLRTVRRPSAHREVFLTLRSPHRPLSRGGLYLVVAPRLKSLNVQTTHHGPHSLRHACAARLVAEGLSLKEVGDHLGHRSTSATRIYAKVDLRSLREVAAFDLGELP